MQITKTVIYLLHCFEYSIALGLVSPDLSDEFLGRPVEDFVVRGALVDLSTSDETGLIGFVKKARSNNELGP